MSRVSKSISATILKGVTETVVSLTVVYELFRRNKGNKLKNSRQKKKEEWRGL